MFVLKIIHIVGIVQELCVNHHNRQLFVGWTAKVIVEHELNPPFYVTGTIIDVIKHDIIALLYLNVPQGFWKDKPIFPVHLDSIVMVKAVCYAIQVTIQ